MAQKSSVSYSGPSTQPPYLSQRSYIPYPTGHPNRKTEIEKGNQEIAPQDMRHVVMQYVGRCLTTLVVFLALSTITTTTTLPTTPRRLRLSLNTRAFMQGANKPRSTVTQPRFSLPDRQIFTFAIMKGNGSQQRSTTAHVKVTPLIAHKVEHSCVPD